MLKPHVVFSSPSKFQLGRLAITLLATTALIAISPGLANADGGAGGAACQGCSGTSGSGGAGGAGYSGQSGSPGGSANYGGGGGGGSAGGGLGGPGGSADNSYNNGAAGGNGGANGNGSGQATVNNLSLMIGADGIGGGSTGSTIGGGYLGGGGGGGAGGYGAIVTASGANSNSSMITGGRGGDGGISGMGTGGNGGDGGVGVQFSPTANGSTLDNSGTISGGQAGNGRAAFITVGGSALGVAGLGGIGVIGENLSIFNSGTISGGTGSSGRANAITFTGTTASALNITSTSIIIGNVVANGTGNTLDLGGSGDQTFNVSQMGTVGSGVQYQGFSSLVKADSSTWTLTGTQSGVLRYTLFGGILSLGSAGALGSAGSILFNGGTLQYSASNQTDYSSRFQNLPFQQFNIDTNGQAVTFASPLNGPSGTLTKSGAGTLTLSAANTYTGLTTLTAGTLAVAASGSVVGGVVNNATFTSAGTVSGGLTNTGTVNANGGAINGAIANNAGTFNVAGTVASDSTFGNANGATLAIGNAGSYTIGDLLSNSGTVTVAAGGQLDATAGGITNMSTGSITVAQGGTIRDDLNNAGPVLNSGNYVANVATNTGTITNGVTGVWTGNVVSNTGLIVNDGMWTGSIATGTGGKLSGTGTVASATFSGGTFAPGNGTPGSSTTIAGNLVLQSAATYLIQVNPASASFATVGGTATLGGATLAVNFASGTYVQRQYSILTAGNVAGMFGRITNTNLPAGFQTSASYDATRAYLNLTLNLIPPPPSGPGAPTYAPLNGNQTSLANTLTNSFNRTGSIPIVFGALTPTGLTQISGESAAGSQQATVDAASQFLGLMTDPFSGGRVNSPGVGPSAYADENEPLAYAGKPRNARDAFAAIHRKAPLGAFDEPRWSTWAAGFGGGQTTDGNGALGSSRTTSQIYGVAAGADYRISQDTLFGFALAGGGTNFRVNALGNGSSDLFQAGAYMRHTQGAAYIAAAAAYGWQDITTDRTLAVAGIDRLRAQFNANAYSGRVEGGYRLALPGSGWGVTPYMAVQATAFDLPAYGEQVVAGTNTFALNYGAKTANASRSELGLRGDKSFAWDDAVVTLRGRFAWAHNYYIDRSAQATFQSLPGASFVVNGARAARDAALTTASAEWKWGNGWATAATFEGEFSNVTRSYAGKGVLRYAW